MEQILKYFPITLEAKNSIGNLIKALVIYALVILISNLISRLLGDIILIGPVISLAGAIISMYCFIGFILTIMYYFDFIK